MRKKKRPIEPETAAGNGLLDRRLFLTEMDLSVSPAGDDFNFANVTDEAGLKPFEQRSEPTRIDETGCVPSAC
jgi:hypothetical protein